MPEEEETFCYNKGCGKKFVLAHNDEGSCKFHPGQPVFHDAYKGWGCCNKKVTDFTEFLNIPGCTVGPHNPDRGPEPEKRAIVPQGQGNGDVETSAPLAKPPPTSAPRHAKDTPMVEVTKKVNSALLELNKAAAAEAKKNPRPEETAPVEIPPGTPCKNNACGREYDPTGGTSEHCWHHPGTAVFHEGMKYWSCCNRKTSDFDAFLSQQGCTRGDHKWIADDKGEDGVLECRDDFHQTGSHVIVTYYLKKSHPFLTRVTANPVSLAVTLHSLQGQRKHDDIDLWGAIVVEESLVTLTPSKVEVKLKKADPVSWAKLHYTPPKEEDS